MADALHTPGAVQAVEARLDDAGLLTPAGPGAMDIRTGVMAGPGSLTILTGTSATGQMTVNVGQHHWVTTRGSASGPYRGAREAATTVNIAAAPASGSRIDVVYVKQQSTESGIPSPDASTGELYGVLQGTSSTGTPGKPDLTTIVGAEELGTVQVAAGATSTSGAGVTITNTARQTVARGGVLPVYSTARPTSPYAGQAIYEIDTRAFGFYESSTGKWIMFDTVWQTYTPVLATSAIGNTWSQGNGTATGRYFRKGREITVECQLVIGSTTNYGAGSTGAIMVKPPVGYFPRDWTLNSAYTMPAPGGAFVSNGGVAFGWATINPGSTASTRWFSFYQTGAAALSGAAGSAGSWNLWSQTQSLLFAVTYETNFEA